MSSDHDPDSADAAGQSAVNVQTALEFTGGDREMLLSVAELFLEEGPRQLEDVSNRIESGNAESIRDAAHKLKGSVVIFGAAQAEAAARALEHSAAGGDLTAVPQQWSALQYEMTRLIPEVEQLCRDLTA